MVITGDLKQSDRGSENGLVDLLHKIKMHNTPSPTLEPKNTHTAIKYVELESVDVQRSAIVKQILDIYDGKKPTQPQPPAPAPAPAQTPAPLSNDDAALIPIHHISKSMKKKTGKKINTKQFHKGR
jgi:hypothetical protein